jgi:hypothetical protein
MSDLPLCVYCRERRVESAWKPFCSERCRMADLGRWLSGNYRVPVRDDDPDRQTDDDTQPEPPGASTGEPEA